MSKKSTLDKDYFELIDHNYTQLVVFYLLIFVSFLLMLDFLMPAIRWLFEDYLLGKVYDNGEKISYLFEQKSAYKTTNWLVAWGVDIYLNTPQQARYWFNPLLSLALPSMMFAVFIAFFISALLPQKYGYIRHKIEREIASILDMIVKRKLDFYDTNERNQIYRSILNADLRDLHDFEAEYGMTRDELKILHNALKWRNRSFLGRLLYINSGIKLYLQLYFTLKYGNTILGSVYMGAAILIIIIGLRGLKFIPQNEPSLVIFALGLEFSLLILFSLTVIYGKDEEAFSNQSNSDGLFLTQHPSLGDSKEVEELLKVFIKSVDKKDNKS